jgi:hypothetical protein
MHKHHWSPVVEAKRHVLARGEIEVWDSDHRLSVDVECYVEVVRIAPAIVSDGGVMS